MMNIPKKHKFKINVEGSRREWAWLAFNVNDVARYSGFLGRLAEDDAVSGSSQVERFLGVSEDALKIIISAIPSEIDTGDLPVLYVQEENPIFGLELLLSLAIACWKYHCPIPPLCVKFARDFHDNWTAHCEDGCHEFVGHALNWMFIALVFGWDGIFKSASVMVVVKYDAAESNVDLPQEFLDHIQHLRNCKMNQTYNFIQKSWMSFWDPTTVTMNRIHAQFKDRFKVDVHLDLPRDSRMYKEECPDSMLTGLIAIVKSSEDGRTNMSPTPELHTSESATVGTAKSSLFADVAASIARDSWTKMRQGHKRTDSDASSQRSRIQQEKMFERKSKSYRTKYLGAIQIADETFVAMRTKNIKAPVSKVRYYSSDDEQSLSGPGIAIVSGFRSLVPGRGKQLRHRP